MAAPTCRGGTFAAQKHVMLLGETGLSEKLSEQKLSGDVIIAELLRNMEVGKFEMAYSVLLPCVFTVYLNPRDHATLCGVFELILDDARKALRARVAGMNAKPSGFALPRRSKTAKEHKIACRDWDIEFLPDAEVPLGDVEIHSELSEVVQPGYRGTKTTLMEREPTASVPRANATTPRAHEATVLRRPVDVVHAELRYQDESGPQVYPMSQNKIRVGRGGDDASMDIALYTSDEVSREHLNLRRDPATGAYFVTDVSTNGTWLNGKRLRKGAEEPLPESADLNLGEVIEVRFEVKK
jgi:hypothetical protein